MNRVFAFIRKEFYHILRDRRTMLILLVMPVVQVLLFGFAISVEVQNVRVAMVGQQFAQDSQQAGRLAQAIDASETFEVTHMFSLISEAEQAMREGKIDVAVCYGQTPAASPVHNDAISIVSDATNPNTASTITFYLQRIIQSTTGGHVAVDVAPRMLYNPQLQSAYNFVPGVMGLVFILICALMTSVSIVREREQGNMEVLLVSPVRPLVIIFSKMIPYFLIACVDLGSVLLLSYFLLKVPIAGSLLAICSLSFVYIFLALSIGLLISTLADSQLIAMIASILGLMLPVVMLSGMIFPIENMPFILQKVSTLIPARWYITGIRKLMIEGLDISKVVTEFVVLIGMTLFVLGIALRKFKIRL